MGNWFLSIIKNSGPSYPSVTDWRWFSTEKKCRNETPHQINCLSAIYDKFLTEFQLTISQYCVEFQAGITNAATWIVHCFWHSFYRNIFTNSLFFFLRFPLFSVVKAENFVVCVYKLRDVYVQRQTKFSPKKPDISALGTL